MGRTLSQQEIDAIIKARKARSSAPERVVRTYDFRATTQLASEKARTLTALHEMFARNLTRSVGAFLRVPFNASLVSVGQIVYREFLEGLQELSYITSFSLQPQNLFGAMQFEDPLVFTMIDVLLGGTGASTATSREITDIEESIVESVAEITCRELEGVWKPFGLQMQLGQRQPHSQMQQFLSPTEKALVLTFDIQIAEARGALQVLFPSAVTRLMAREAAKDWARHAARLDQKVSQRLRQKLNDCSFQLELGVPGIKTRMRELMSLKTGDVLRLAASVQSGASLMVGGRTIFRALPVRKGSRRAAQLSGSLLNTLPVGSER